MTTGSNDTSEAIRTREAAGTRLGSRHEAEGGTLLLASLAAATLTAARVESAWSAGGMMVQAAVFVGGAAVVWIGLQRMSAFRARADAWMVAALAFWVVLPCVGEAVARRSGAGDAPEIIMLASLQNAALILAAYSHRRRCQQTAILLASFLVLFALVMGTSRTLFLLAGLYGVLVLWWLMARYWERVSQARAATSVQRCLPMRSSVLAGTCAVVLAAGGALGGVGGTTYVLRGFLPTSGGDRWYDPFARAGVGDGDAMVAAREDAMSFGPVESELFLESDMPTLYDMFNELYGDPPKPTGNRERAISLDSGTVKDTHERIARTQRSGQEFSTLRKRIALQRKPLEDRDAPAMLYLVGRVPLHLALETFDTFDGTAWHQTTAGAQPPPLGFERRGDKAWITVRSASESPVLRETELHAVKFINLRSVRIPAPPLLDALHIDRLDQADFFAWTDDGQIEMPGREQIPQLTVVHVRSRGMNLEPLRNQDFAIPSAATRPTGSGVVFGRDLNRLESALPEDDFGPLAANTTPVHLRIPDQSLAACEAAAAWTRAVPRGWRQVEAVVARLRSDFQLDGEVRIPEDCTDPVGWFLDARTGPDYLFATTAAVILRSLGYATRLTTGFYARPERFDRRAGQTAVLAEDVHVWVEVCIDGRTWIPIEPTPGYAPPRERLTWRQWTAFVAQDAARWAGRHAVLLSLLLVATVIGWFRRLAVFDALAYGVWRVAAGTEGERRVRWTVRLLEWRGWCCGRPRPRNATLSHWYARMADRLPSETAFSLHAFLRAAERTLYAPPPAGRNGALPLDVNRTCRHVAREVTGRRMQK